MEDYELDIIIGQGPGARSVKVPLQKFTLVGATTRAGLLTVAAARAVRHRPPAGLLQRSTTSRRSSAARRASSTCRSTPTRRARLRGARAARRASPTACCAACATSRRCAPTAGSRPRWRAAALELLEVDEHGFDEVDRKLLRTIIDKFGGGPVGVNSLAAAINEEKDAIEDIYEPFLIQAGFLDRTPRGRVATPRAYEYFGLDRAREGFPSVVTVASRRTVRRARIASLATYVPPQAADQRRPREDGRDERRMDPAAHRHPGAPHRRCRASATSDLADEAAREAIDAPASHPPTSTSSSSARRRPT